jgi:hypothetical protein
MTHLGQKHGFAGQIHNGIVVHIGRHFATETLNDVACVSIPTRVMDHPSLAFGFFRGVIHGLIVARE